MFYLVTLCQLSCYTKVLPDSQARYLKVFLVSVVSNRPLGLRTRCLVSLTAQKAQNHGNFLLEARKSSPILDLHTFASLKL